MSCCMGDAAETSTRFREVLSVCDGWLSYLACCAIYTHTVLTVKGCLPNMSSSSKDFDNLDCQGHHGSLLL